MRLRFSHETQRSSRSMPSSNGRLFSAVIQLTSPSNRLKSGVVRTTSPVAPSLIINTFIDVRGARRGECKAKADSRHAETETPTSESDLLCLDQTRRRRVIGHNPAAKSMRIFDVH